MSFGGAVYDSVRGVQAAQRLPGLVDLEKDFGYNLQQAAYSLWILAKCIDWLKKEIRPLATEMWGTRKVEITNKFFTDIPHVGLDSEGVVIAGLIHSGNGVTYKVKVDFNRQQQSGTVLSHLMQPVKKKGAATKSRSTFYALKLIFPQRNERYGSSVHRLLAQHNFAPAFYSEFAPNVEDMENKIKHVLPFKPDPLIMYYLMELLSPPTQEEPGWITVEKFGEHANLAALYKDDIRKALEHIANLLRRNQMVHGDVRPNNVMIRVKINGNWFRPLYRVGQKLIDIRVVNFDWSGQAGKVRYPAVRPFPVKYLPREDGQTILQEDDWRMAAAWMKTWPKESDSTKKA